ncbi:MAG: PAS domain S-box protein [Candidatus Methanofastidiosum sp.]|nr:PAS domain S-box protein [Methanofastidiosum sp.]
MTKTRILLVDDDIKVLEATSRIIKSLDCDLEEASSGKECLDKIYDFKPDLVILDVVMPDIDGITLCKKIKSDPKLTGTFVVLVSGVKISPDQQAQGLESLADGYIQRPFVSREFIARIESLLRIQKTEKALRESESKFKTIFDNAKDAIYIHDLNGNFLEVNKTACKILGYSKEELLKMSPKQIDSPKYAKLVESKIIELINNGEAFFETEHIKKSGKIIPIELSSKVIQFQGQKSIISIARDISLRKELECELEKSQDLLLETGFIAKVGGWEIDVFTMKQNWTEEVYRIHEVDFDYEPDVEKSLSFYTPKSWPIIEKAVNEAIENGTPYDLKLEFISAKGNHKWVHARGKAHQINGKTVRVSGTFQDITKEMVNEIKLRDLNETLRVLNKILRHDILNDLTIVLTVCDLMKDADPKLKQKAAIALDKSVNLIERMRELEYTLTSGGEVKSYDLRKIIENVTKNYPEIKFYINGDCNVLADEAINSVIDNLLRNAVVHGKTERIDINIVPDYKTCTIELSDFGIGIPEEYMSKIFEEGESFGETRGTGLGLYIVKKVIERYCGEIKVEDNKPKGTKFIITLLKA